MQANQLTAKTTLVQEYALACLFGLRADPLCARASLQSGSLSGLPLPSPTASSSLAAIHENQPLNSPANAQSPHAHASDAAPTVTVTVDTLAPPGANALDGRHSRSSSSAAAAAAAHSRTSSATPEGLATAAAAVATATAAAIAQTLAPPPVPRRKPSQPKGLAQAGEQLAQEQQQQQLAAPATNNGQPKKGRHSRPGSQHDLQAKQKAGHAGLGAFGAMPPASPTNSAAAAGASNSAGVRLAGSPQASPKESAYAGDADADAVDANGIGDVKAAPKSLQFEEAVAVRLGCCPDCRLI